MAKIATEATVFERVAAARIFSRRIQPSDTCRRYRRFSHDISRRCMITSLAGLDIRRSFEAARKLISATRYRFHQISAEDDFMQMPAAPEMTRRHENCFPRRGHRGLPPPNSLRRPRDKTLHERYDPCRAVPSLPPSMLLLIYHLYRALLVAFHATPATAHSMKQKSISIDFAMSRLATFRTLWLHTTRMAFQSEPRIIS